MVLVAHPFASMLVTLGMTESRDGEGAGPDEVEERRITAPVESMVSLLDDSHLGRT